MFFEKITASVDKAPIRFENVVILGDFIIDANARFQ